MRITKNNNNKRNIKQLNCFADLYDKRRIRLLLENEIGTTFNNYDFYGVGKRKKENVRVSYLLLLKGRPTPISLSIIISKFTASKYVVSRMFTGYFVFILIIYVEWLDILQ